jgi:hypothetical protein
VDGAVHPPSKDENLPLLLETLVARVKFNDFTWGESTERNIESLVTDLDLPALRPFRFSQEWVRAVLYGTLAHLYSQRYARQGPERADNLEAYRLEDSEAWMRTTRFINMIDDTVVSHVQAQSSSSLGEKLNFEKHFDTGSMISRAPGELIFEVGRLELIRSKDLSEAVRAKMKKMGLTREMLLRKTLQKVVTWLNRDVMPSRVFFQINGKMLRVLEGVLPRGALAKRYPVSQSPGAPIEYIVECDRKTMLAIEDHLITRIIYERLERDLTGAVSEPRSTEDPPKWNWIFWPNEWPALERLKAGFHAFRDRAMDDVRKSLLLTLDYQSAMDYVHHLWERFQNEMKVAPVSASDVDSAFGAKSPEGRPEGAVR